MDRPSRKDRERIQHREEILRAAEVVFAEKGFHRCSVEEIAERAEFSVGTLYNFFGSKEGLYNELIMQRVKELSDHVHAALDEAQEPIAIVQVYLRAKTELCVKYGDFVRLYVRERLGDRFGESELWRERVGPLYQGVVDRLAEVFRAGIAKGCFRGDIDPADMAVAIEGISDGFLFESFAFGGEGTFSEKYETMIGLFLDGISAK